MTVQPPARTAPDPRVQKDELTQAEIVDAVTVDEVASVLVEELQARIAEAQKRASA